MNTDDCLFCRIAAGTAAAEIALESEHALGFRDIHPKAPEHWLVIPRRHIASLAEVTAADAAVLGDTLILAAKLAAARGLTGGYRVVNNIGRHGGQSVAHLHLHVLGGRQLRWPPG